MDYQVPQFIEVEDKIFGPLTLKQFIYLAGGAGLCAILVLSLPLILGIILSIPVGVLSAALAFYKVNNKPFIEILEAGVHYYFGKRLYLWRKEKEVPETQVAAPEEAVAAKMPGLSKTKLEELAWSLDVKNTDQNDTSSHA